VQLLPWLGMAGSDRVLSSTVGRVRLMAMLCLHPSRLHFITRPAAADCSPSLGITPPSQVHHVRATDGAAGRGHEHGDAAASGWPGAGQRAWHGRAERAGHAQHSGGSGHVRAAVRQAGNRVLWGGIV
jgi:hypothetical protein